MCDWDHIFLKGKKINHFYTNYTINVLFPHLLIHCILSLNIISRMSRIWYISIFFHTSIVTVKFFLVPIRSIYLFHHSGESFLHYGFFPLPPLHCGPQNISIFCTSMLWYSAIIFTPAVAQSPTGCAIKNFLASFLTTLLPCLTLYLASFVHM